MIDNPYAAPQSNVTAAPGRNDFTDLPFKDLKKLRNHSHSIRALMVLLLLVGGFGLLGSLAAFFIKDPETVRGGLIASAFITISGVGLIQRGTAGRVLAIICSAVMLILFPVGTLIGVLALIALGNKQLFGPDRIQHKSLETEFRYRKKNRID